MLLKTSNAAYILISNAADILITSIGKVSDAMLKSTAIVPNPLNYSQIFIFLVLRDDVDDNLLDSNSQATDYHAHVV